jgi:hypothetical protein
MITDLSSVSIASLSLLAEMLGRARGVSRLSALALHGIHGTIVAGPSGANGISINHSPPKPPGPLPLIANQQETRSKKTGLKSV